MTWNGFNIVCVNVDEESEFDDPRAITEFGIQAPKLRVKAADMVWSIQQSRGHYVHLEVNGEEINPIPEREDGVRYLRVADTLTSEDPLMELPTCTEYKLQERVENAQ